MNKRYTSIVWLIIFIFATVCSCGDKPYPQEMKRAEQIILANPDSALNILNHLNKQIKSEPESTRMYYEVLLCRAQDLCYFTHKSDETMKKAVEYYKDKKEYDKLLQAYYCLGCIYRDFGDAPEAIKSFQKALDLIKYCNDNAMKARIYSQIGHLQQITFSGKDALNSFILALKYFELANDSLTIPSAERDVALSYKELRQINKTKKYCEMACLSANKIKDKKRNADMKLGISQIYFCMDDYKGAAKVLQGLKENSFSKQDKPAYYLSMGLIYDDKDMEDSAIYFFKRAAEIGNSFNKEEAYTYLCQIYKGINDTGNYIKYMEICNEISTENLVKSHDKEVAKLQHLYNYQRTENANKQLDLENARNRIIIFLLVAIVIVSVVAILLYRQRGKLILQQKNRLIEELKKQQETNTGDKAKVEENPWERFRKSDIYGTFHRAVVNGELIYKSEQMNGYWEALKAATDEIFNNFSMKLTAICPSINEKERKLCMMEKLELPFTTMAALLYTSPSNITNMRNRLCRKCHYHDPNGKTFDDFIHDL